MAFVLADRVKETTTTSGTGAVTLLGASTGFQSFAAVGNANTTYYCIAGQTTSQWEVGIGTYTASGTTLARTTVLANSAGTQPTALTFLSGTKDVFVTYPAGKSVNYDAANNVGIGTTSPGVKLDVQSAGSDNVFRVAGTGSGAYVTSVFENSNAGGYAQHLFNVGAGGASGQAQIGYAPGIFFAIGPTSNDTTTPIVFRNNNATERMRLDASGNLGLGVTPSAWYNTFKVLDVGASGAAGSSSTSQFIATSNAYLNASIAWIYKNTDAAAYYNQSSGVHSWAIAPPGTAGNTITFTEALTLNSSGQLETGIAGTAAAPSFTRTGDLNTGIFFPAADTIAFSEGGTEALRINSSGQTETGIAGTAALPSFTRTGDVNTGIFFPAADTIAFAEGGSEAARFDASANFQVRAGAVVVWAPAPASISAAATLTNANIQGQLINTTGTTYTVTMPLGTTMETLVPWAAVNLGYDFTVINTASGTITMAVNTGVTSLGGLTIATGVSAGFRIRRTAANTFILYRLR